MQDSRSLGVVYENQQGKRGSRSLYTNYRYFSDDQKEEIMKCISYIVHKPDTDKYMVDQISSICYPNTPVFDKVRLTFHLEDTETFTTEFKLVKSTSKSCKYYISVLFSSNNSMFKDEIVKVQLQRFDQPCPEKYLEFLLAQAIYYGFHAPAYTLNCVMDPIF